MRSALVGLILAAACTVGVRHLDGTGPQANAPRRTEAQRLAACETMRTYAAGWGDVDCASTVRDTTWGR